MVTQISKHITYQEAIHSMTAKRLGIDNTPTEMQIINMMMLAQEIFEPLRAYVRGPIKINSFFRSKELNIQVGGSRTSQHMCNDLSAAIDLDDVYGRKTNMQMFNWIKAHLNFDQLIAEGYDKETDSCRWVHVSYGGYALNRNQVLYL